MTKGGQLGKTGGAHERAYFLLIPLHVGPCKTYSNNRFMAILLGFRCQSIRMKAALRQRTGLKSTYLILGVGGAVLLNTTY